MCSSDLALGAGFGKLANPFSFGTGSSSNASSGTPVTTLIKKGLDNLMLFQIISLCFGVVLVAWLIKRQISRVL